MQPRPALRLAALDAATTRSLLATLRASGQLACSPLPRPAAPCRAAPRCAALRRAAPRSAAQGPPDARTVRQSRCFVAGEIQGARVAGADRLVAPPRPGPRPTGVYQRSPRPRLGIGVAEAGRGESSQNVRRVGLARGRDVTAISVRDQHKRLVAAQRLASRAADERALAAQDGQRRRRRRWRRRSRRLLQSRGRRAAARAAARGAGGGGDVRVAHGGGGSSERGGRGRRARHGIRVAPAG